MSSHKKNPATLTFAHTKIRLNFKKRKPCVTFTARDSNNLINCGLNDEVRTNHFDI